jgi:hypothetical protein
MNVWCAWGNLRDLPLPGADNDSPRRFLYIPLRQVGGEKGWRAVGSEE